VGASATIERPSSGKGPDPSGFQTDKF